MRLGSLAAMGECGPFMISGIPTHTKSAAQSKHKIGKNPGVVRWHAAKVLTNARIVWDAMVRKA